LRRADEGEPRDRDEDAALWAAFLGGDEPAFEQLYRRIGPTLLRFLGRTFQLQHADAANLTQHVFLSLYARRAAVGFDPGRARFRTWFWHYARCRSIDELRKRRRAQSDASLEDNLGAEEALAERAAACQREQEEQEDRRAAVLLCLERHDCLDENEKYVIRHSNTEGLGELPQKEVAAALGLSPGQISKLKQAAIRKLSACVRSRT
jgi:RNA polymerase sigma factor (sigma-70 family)